MKHLSLKAKITMWFSILLSVIVAIMFVLMFVISDSVLKTDVKEHLTDIVKTNAQEIEYFANIEEEEREVGDHYVEYAGGFLEIDDDFLDEYNGVHTALYDSQGNLLYGESVVDTPIIQFDTIETVTKDREKYYVYCQHLTSESLEGLILRGTVSKDANKTVLSEIVRLSMLLLPLLALLAIIGGYVIARRSLRPINEISRAAEEISDGGDLSKRIEIGPGGDEIHALADTFNKMFERLEQSFEAEKQFTSDISHELRTPITVINAQSELILERERTPEQYKRAFIVVERQSGRMRDIVDEMLSYSRLSRMESLTKIEPVNLSRLVTELTEEQVTLREKRIKLSCQVQEGITVNADIHLLARLITNLITNAYRYGKEDGHTVVKLEKKNDEIYLSVADDGIGIEQSELQKIWNRFYQVDKARTADVKYSGIGLGLPMVNRIAMLHGGRMEVESRDGEGSVFTFIMPA